MPGTPNTTDRGDSNDSTTAGDGQTPRPGDTGGLVEQAGPTLKPVVGEAMTNLTKDVVRALGVAEFIDKNKPIIYGNLERFDQQANATAATVDPNMMFIALSLPVINGIIHIASTQSGLQKAIALVKGDSAQDKDLDAISILSALTLLYVAAIGKDDFAGSANSQTWDRIFRRVKNFSDPKKSP